MTRPPGQPVNIRPGTDADIRSMVELERACPTAGHWTEAQYRQAIQPGGQHRLVLVAEGPPLAGAIVDRQGESAILGFLVARHVPPEWELENIAVVTAARRNGLGTKLLDALFASTRKTTSEAVFLEVRESNAAARRLYERVGFAPTGRRKAYYANPSEDAILYRLQVAAPGHQGS